MTRVRTVNALACWLAGIAVALLVFGLPTAAVAALTLATCLQVWTAEQLRVAILQRESDR